MGIVNINKREVTKINRNKRTNNSSSVVSYGTSGTSGGTTINWAEVTPDLVTINRNLKVTGNITATEDVIAYVAGAVSSDVLSALSVNAPLEKVGASTIKLNINPAQMQVNASNQLEVIPGILAPAAHSHLVSDVTGLQTSLDSKLSTSLKGAVNGLAELDANGFVKNAQLPSYVDDVLEYASSLFLPETGESGKIYITTNDNKTFRWSGSSYAEISQSLALGVTAQTAYRGDLGNIAYTHSQVTHDKNLVGLSNVDNTSDANKPVSTATQTALNLKANLASPTFTGRLQVSGSSSGYPATTGTTQPTAFTRFQHSDSNLALDMGSYGSNGAWLQVTNATDLSLKYPILLNPNGGNVGIGSTSSTNNLTVTNKTADASIRLGSGNSGSYNADLFLGTDTRDWRIRSLTGVNGYAFNISYVGTDAPASNVLHLTKGGNVGINTTSNNETLTIVGKTTSYGAISIIPESTTYSSYKLKLATQPANEGAYLSMGGTKVLSMYGYDVASEVGLGTQNNPNSLYLKGNNVGIGYTSGTEITNNKLAVNGTSYFGNTATFNSPNYGDTQIKLTTGASTYSSLMYSALTGEFRITQSDGGVGITFYTGNITPTEKVRLANNGNFGIGYATGTEITNNKLAVNGGAYFNGTITATNLSVTGGATVTNTVTASSLSLTNTDADILKSTTTGQVRIAGGTSASSSTGAVIQAFGNDYATAAYKGQVRILAGKGDGTANFGSIYLSTVNAALANTERFKITGGTDTATASFSACNVTVSGNITAGGEVTAYSDKRLKSNIEPLKIRGELKPVTYTKDGKESIGFIAQQVKEVYPELVQGDESKEMLSLNYQQLTAVLYAEILELKERIKKLEGENK